MELSGTQRYSPRLWKLSTYTYAGDGLGGRDVRPGEAEPQFYVYIWQRYEDLVATRTDGRAGWLVGWLGA